MMLIPKPARICGKARNHLCTLQLACVQATIILWAPPLLDLLDLEGILHRAMALFFVPNGNMVKFGSSTLIRPKYLKRPKQKIYIHCLKADLRISSATKT